MSSREKGAGTFNIRVYGLWMEQGQILVTEEKIGTRWVQKFPGGGLLWGEGVMDTLRREWKEELGMDPGPAHHYYTTDFFQASALDGSQVLSLYYLVRPLWPQDKPLEELRHLEEDCRAYWRSLQEMDPGEFPLPIDRVVAQKIKEDWETRERGFPGLP